MREYTYQVDESYIAHLKDKHEQRELQLYALKGWRCPLCDAMHGQHTMCQANFYDESLDGVE